MKKEKLKSDGIILQLIVLYTLFHVDTNVMVNFCECSSNKVCLILRIGNFGRFVGSFFAIKKEIDIPRLQLIFAVVVIFDILTQVCKRTQRHHLRPRDRPSRQMAHNGTQGQAGQHFLTFLSTRRSTCLPVLYCVTGRKWD